MKSEQHRQEMAERKQRREFRSERRRLDAMQSAEELPDEIVEVIRDARAGRSQIVRRAPASQFEELAVEAAEQKRQERRERNLSNRGNGSGQ